MLRIFSIRVGVVVLAVGVGLGLAGMAAWGQSSSQGQTPAQGQAPASQPAGNDFPGEEPKPRTQQQTPGQAPDAGQPAGGGGNAFPGEEPGAAGPAGSSGSGGAAASGAPDAYGDPVRSPDPVGNVINDDGFTSSKAGLRPDLAESDTDSKPGSSKHTKTREQVLKEDVDIGSFYLSRKDWKGAEGRFEDAVRLDAEDEDAVWGLAESERHLQQWSKAGEHYKLFLSYDPDGPHSKEARKALQQVEAAGPADAAAPGRVTSPNP